MNIYEYQLFNSCNFSSKAVVLIVNCFLERRVQFLLYFFNFFFFKGLRLIFVIFVTLFLERILRATGGGARAGVRQGQRQLLGGDGLLCERLHLGKVEIMTMLTNFLSKSFKP